jgi:beta-glucosidase
LTFNEPGIYAAQSYFLGVWPPQHRRLGDYCRCIANLANCHIQIYKLIKKLAGDTITKVSYAHSYALIKGAKGSPLGHLFAHYYSLFNNQLIFNSFFKGIFRNGLKNYGHHPKGKYADFIALNYYAISYLKGMTPFIPAQSPITDFNWIIHPQGIVESLDQMIKFLPGTPIYITENGVCDYNDQFRTKYLYDHLLALENSSHTIERYYLWSMLDNFEWDSGLTPQFGIVAVDQATYTRTPKKSYHFFKALSEHELSDPEIQEFITNISYNLSK